MNNKNDDLLRAYINDRNAARDGLTEDDIPVCGLDDLEAINWRCGFVDFLAEIDEQEELFNEQ